MWSTGQRLLKLGPVYAPVQDEDGAEQLLHLPPDGMSSVDAAVRKATEADAQRPPQQEPVTGAHGDRAAAPAEAADTSSQPLLSASASVSLMRRAAYMCASVSRNTDKQEAHACELLQLCSACRQELPAYAL